MTNLKIAETLDSLRGLYQELSQKELFYLKKQETLLALHCCLELVHLSYSQRVITLRERVDMAEAVLFDYCSLYKPSQCKPFSPSHPIPNPPNA